MRFTVPGRTALFVVLLLASAGFVWLSDGLKQGEDLLIQRKYKEAATQLEGALGDAPAAEQDRILLLLGRARWLAGDVAGAVRAYEQLVRNHPGSSLVHKARLQQAEALASKADFRAAAPIYRAEIERLVGLSRKEEIATTYLGLAEKALAKTPPDYNRAVTFFDLALDLGMSKDRERSVRLQAAEARLKSGNYHDAMVRLGPLAKKLTVEQGKLRAMLGLGRARSRAGDRAGARTVLKDLIAVSKTAKEAADAAYEIAVSYGVPRPAPRDLDRAVKALTDLARDYPDHEQAKVALFLTAQCYQHVGRSEDALKALGAFLDQDHGPDLGEVALAREMVGDVLAGQGKLVAAIQAWRAYLSAHPSHKDWERVQRAIVDTEFRMAHEAFAAGKKEFDKARRLFAEFGRSYPIDHRNPEILFLLGEMLFAEENYELAREAFARCVSKYPGKEASSHAQFRIGEIYESKVFNYLDALKAYQKVTWGSWAVKARERIERLTKKSLCLFTEKTYRTGEKAVFKLTSRNIEKVRVRVFRLDLETYFRATHTADSVDRLDIEVIEPDKTFDSAVGRYVKYQETERLVDIGFTKPGAYVVKVDDRELEATTMVLITDVALIAKSSRHELFVFGQNLKENRVEAGMRIVLSNGKKVLAEGLTDPKGVWRYKGKELQNNDELRVFAFNAAGSGASNISLSGMGYSQGLTPKCYIFTDRPVYQPGQLVHIKGIMREVKDGIYQLPAQEDYRLQVFGASGRMVLQREIRFTPFGGFAADVALPPQAVLGEWRIRVDQGPRSGQSFAGSFLVERYERPRLSLSADLDKRVVYRGETIQGRLKLAYFFGEPAVGKRIEYTMRLPDGGLIQRQGVTNAAGELPFEFPTKDFGEEAVARIDARMTTENVATAVLVPVVTTEFTATLSIVRSVYLAGEPFDVSMEIKDRAGKPLGRKGRVRLFRRERQGKAVVEVEVSSKDFQTDAKDGKGRVTFVAQRGGDYLARVESTDRFGMRITAQLSLQVSGEDDEIKLRLLSDKQFYKVGDTLKVKVANRAGDRLVLRTIQGDGILVHDSVILKKGESGIEFQLEPLHAPNFALALAMIDGTRLRTAQREFRVSRDLRVVVEPQKAVARPGEEVEIEIKATDPRGRPVQAEVALSLVDQALLQSYPDKNPKLGVFFYGQLRETGFRTVSSCTWSYRGPSRRMSRELLAEERRLKEEAEKAPEATGADDVFVRQPRAAAPGAPAPGAPVTPAEEPGRAMDRRKEQAKAGLGQELDKDAARQPHKLGVGGGAGGKFGQTLEGKNLRAIQDYLKRVDRQQGQLAGLELQGVEVDALESPALDKPRTDFSETGAWLSAVVTGEDGTAKVKVKLPDSTTGFSVVARGATKDTYVGEGRSVLRTAKKLQVGVLAPPTLTEGDRAVGTGHVHNLSGETLSADLLWSTEQGSQTTKHEGRVDLAQGKEHEFKFPFTATSSADMRIHLEAAGGDHKDSLEGGIVVRPFGMEYRDGRSGHTSQGASFQLGLPGGREFTRLAMAIQIGRDPGRDLVAAALGQGYRPFNCRRVDTTNLSLASRGIAALLVLDYLEEARRSTPADAARLRGLAASCVSRLVQSQAADGGMAWIGDRQPDLRTTSQVVRFLQMAKQRGMAPAATPLHRAEEWLLQHMRRARTEDRCRAALSLARRVGFSTLNGLHRGRAGFDLQSLSHLALAWHELGRKGLANEVLGELKGKLDLGGLKNTAQVEVIGLAATALLKSDPRDAMGLKCLEWLRAQRLGASWGTPEAMAAALWALTTAGGLGEAAGSHAEVKILVNGRELATVPASVKNANTSFDVPLEWLKERDNQVDIKVTGRGKVYYGASLTGFAKGFRGEDRRRDIVEIKRKYLPAYLRHEGKVLQPGFGVVTGRNIRSFENKLTKLAVGETGRVQVSFWTRDPHRRHISPLVVEEPIPAGCTVPKDSIHGSFEHMVLEPDRMTFYFREGVTYGSFYYEIQARFEGVYQVLPTRAYGALRPDLLAHGPTRTFTVLPHGSVEKDPYRLSPDELYHLGKALFDAGKLEEAGEHLNRLLTEWQKEQFHLHDHYYKDVARMMLFVAVDQRDSKSIVRFFEVLKEQYPELVIPFDKIVAVGRAYLDLGEFEQSVMVFRATAESSYLKEAAVAKTLENLGELKASVRFLRQLLLSYPDLNTIRISLYSIGQQLAAIAARIPPGAPVNQKVGRADQLRSGALSVFREFLILYPEDPLAEEVSFAWATTLVEGQDLKGSLAVAEAALDRYPKSTFEDELLYTAGYVHFALGKHQEAFRILQRVATEEFPRPNGGRGPSENRYHAIYLQGQIYHAMGQPAKALDEYKKVKDRFSDAGEAEDFFLRKRLSLPEVKAFKLDERVMLPLSYRNLTEAEIQIYRVDLMRLYILEKSLNDIRGIQLHGIKPYAEMKVKLGDGRDYRNKEKSLELSPKEPGAYLVVCRGGDLLTTGMVLRTNLKIEAQEFLNVGRLRVNVKDDKGYVGNAHVKVIGSGDQRFRSGDTDLRGIFVGENLMGQATVIVRKGDQYAFFRGKGINQPHHYRPPAQARQPAHKPQVQQRANAQDFKAWGNNLQYNDQNRAKQIEWLQREVMNKQQKGVEVYRTK